MSKKSAILKVLLAVAILSLIFSVGCGKKNKIEDCKPEQSKQQPPKESEVAKPTETPSHPDYGTPTENPNMKRVYFDFDKSDIRADQKATLDNNAKYLMANPDVKILIEGHCDERGTNEYNMSLGERRANSVKEYLKAKGVKNQLATISKGEEEPAEKGHDEAAWSKNRRAQFMDVK